MNDNFNDVESFVENVFECLDESAVTINVEDFETVRSQVNATIATKAFAPDVLGVVENFVELMDAAEESGLESITLTEKESLFLSNVLGGI